MVSLGGWGDRGWYHWGDRGGITNIKHDPMKASIVDFSNIKSNSVDFAQPPKQQGKFKCFNVL